jgi:hypothetical protein
MRKNVNVLTCYPLVEKEKKKIKLIFTVPLQEKPAFQSMNL